MWPPFNRFIVVCLQRSVLSLLLIGTNAFAQTRCPPGAAPGSVQCQPDLPVGNGGQGQTIIRHVGSWEKTWGAMAESQNKVGGASTGASSEVEARRLAIEDCSERGGEDCKAYFSYFNQCAAVVNPDSGGPAITASAGKLEDAKKDGIEKCRSVNGGACNVVFSNCTEPKYHR